MLLIRYSFNTDDIFFRFNLYRSKGTGNSTQTIIFLDFISLYVTKNNLQVFVDKTK